VVEGPEVLAVVDPGDEPAGSADRPRGALAEVLALERQIGKVVAFLVCSHGHGDHIANLGVFRDAFPRAAVVAHEAGPCEPDLPVERERGLPGLGDARLLPGPGHSPWGDDLALFVPADGVLLSGDLVQPKGDTWEQAFYPSPYPYFLDAETYCSSLERLLALEFGVLVTGHREARRGAAARAWVELTLASIRRVGAAVQAWPDGDLDTAAPRIWQALADERGIPRRRQAERLARHGGPSAFERFDRPGIADCWQRLRGAPR
jgi:glyoxylase-like metal-dependent hydrolase (beta-lactamase superfamily II)